jgi:excisionase family DNA binding protein
MSEQALTVAEVAEALRVDQKTVREWIRRGELEATRLPGGDYRIWPSALQVWIEQRSTSQQQGQ